MYDAIRRSLLDPNTLLGAALWGIAFVGLAMALAALIRRFSRRVEPHLSDVTGLRFISAFTQVLAYLIGFILYAQNTLSNLIAGLSLVLYRPIRVGDEVQLATPRGLMTAKVELVSLGYTMLRDTETNQIVVPNSVVASSVVIRLARTSKPADSAAG